MPPALPNAATEPALHRPHAWQETRGSRRPEEGHRDRGSQCIGPATLVEARRMASARRVARASYCFRRELRCDGDGGPAESPAGLVVLRLSGCETLQPLER